MATSLVCPCCQASWKCPTICSRNNALIWNYLRVHKPSDQQINVENVDEMLRRQSPTNRRRDLKKEDAQDDGGLVNLRSLEPMKTFDVFVNLCHEIFSACRVASSVRSSATLLHPVWGHHSVWGRCCIWMDRISQYISASFVKGLYTRLTCYMHRRLGLVMHLRMNVVRYRSRTLVSVQELDVLLVGDEDSIDMQVSTWRGCHWCQI